MAATKKDPPISAVALLIDNLQSEDSKKRLKSVEDVAVIARALGAERTRNELLPFLAEMADDDEEILITLSEALGNFVNLVGGPAHVLPLVRLLESLSCVEEIAVREKVILVGMA